MHRLNHLRTAPLLSFVTRRATRSIETSRWITRAAVDEILRERKVESRSLALIKNCFRRNWKGRRL